MDLLSAALLLLALFNHAQGSQVSEMRVCARKYSSVEHSSIQRAAYDDSAEDDGKGEVQGGVGDTERCAKASNYCYALWEEDPTTNGTSIIIMGQGCWESSGRHGCERPDCVADRKPSKARNTTRFCCCSGDLCNVNVTDMYVAPATFDGTQIPTPSTDFLEQVARSERQTIIIVSSCVVTVVGIALLVAVALYRLWCVGSGALGKPGSDAVHLMENGGLSGGLASFAVENLKLGGIVGQGRYGSVWKGSLHDQDVAVKIFPSHHRNYFLNERDIYTLPFMECPALLTYFGCDERMGLEGCPEYLLVLSYAPNGCLRDYLRSNLLDWSTFCRMSQGVAKGLAHLHTDIRKGDKFKPCVSHRDLNTRNILVTADLNSVLCDLGFAMKLQGSKYYCNGEEQHAETKSINDVGTLRYMAPEVLEGAVNLRDCESSLKQIDVYALGLVLWELATRCTDMYQSCVEPPPYRLPFEAEVGHHPSFEQMQVLVSRHKARPLFPETWRDWTAVRLLRETIEDCWDQDAEARLTALCVEERLQELPVLWERQRATIYVSGVSPTINPTFPSGNQGQLGSGLRTANNNNNHNNQQNLHNNQNNNSGSLGKLIASGIMNNDLNISLQFPGCSVRSVSQSSTIFGKETRESTVSEGTVETMVTMSPSEPHSDPSCKNSNHTAVMNGYGIPITTATAFSQPCSRGPLQPFQGRNPCMERNLMLTGASEEELSCNGNTLVDRSLKHAFESQALMSHDFLAATVNNGPRPATPIPYVQNAVYDLYSTVPKQPNIPGNGSAIEPASTGKTSRWSSGWGGLKKLLDSKKKLLFGGLKNRGESTSHLGSPPNYGAKDNETLENDDVKSNLLVRQNGVIGLAAPIKKSPMIMETQVCLLPPGKIGNGIGGAGKNGVVTSVMSPSNRHLSSPPLTTTTHVKPRRSESEDGSGSTVKVKHRRPSTLPLLSVKQPSTETSEVDAARQSLEEQFQRVFGSSSVDASRLKDPSLRVKTPGDVPPSVRRNRARGSKNSTARFSLYDDRMMAGGIDPDEYSQVPAAGSAGNGDGGQTLSISVPIDIDISGSSDAVVVPKKRSSSVKKDMKANESTTCSF
ncbi:bone morphogenetic protein receptor type-2 [Anabrus simplex]|uniref:bone morphogenetic protein receptor type-2 n=1 Tax=Anabrus simplex TaxID=316456 RepID=UPI0035A3463F